MYLAKNLQNLYCHECSPFNSSDDDFFDINQLAKTVKSNPLVGNKILLARCSKLSNIVPFQKVKSDNSLKDKTVKKPKAQIPMPIVIADTFLEIFFCSIIQATEGSSRLMADVNAAKPSKIKNREPNRVPPDI
jgi:hypothetical protein